MVRDPRFELGEVRGTVLRMDWLGCLTSAPSLLLEYGDGVFYAQCELIDPDEIEAYFQPYIDYGNALDDKAREGNKL